MATKIPTVATVSGTEDGEAGALGGTSRRDFAIGTLGGMAAVLLASCLDTTGESTEEVEATGAEAPAAGGAPPTSPLGGDSTITSCTVYPRETQGPFYLDLNLLRRDITDGRAGVPLTINVQVIQASSCAPIKDAAVDVWHCDALGLYSGYPGQGDNHNIDTSGQRFLRGTQVTDSAGHAAFDTVYPGWYRGRTTHIHFKVHVGTRVATSQMYFPEAITAAVYRRSPYATRGQKDTSNSGDGIAHPLPPLLALTQSGNGYVATLTITVR